MFKTQAERLKNFLLIVILIIAFNIQGYGQEIPLVYNVENTGADFPLPVLPSFSELPVIRPLTDPFEWSDGSGRDTTFESWSQRRSEIKAEIEHYEIGTKPNRPENMNAVVVDNNTLFISIIENNDTLYLSAPVILPDGEGPFPAVIVMDIMTLPSSIFTNRDIAIINFSSAQVMAHTQTRGSEPINKLYPELTYMGAYSAWSWGVSRIIDGLEMVQENLPVDLEHLAVTGCSYAGKMALFAGAFDERIALTIAQEPGGGGAAAWRVSQTLGDVETLGATSHAWFIEDMFRFSGSNVSRLPHDHHELIAMVAPRAFLMLGNPDYKWLADESGYISCRAAHQVWKNFGIEDRMGFSIIGGHSHCQLPQSQYSEIAAFVDKFLLGDTTANTNITRSIYQNVNYSKWYEWWGTGKPEFPEPKLTERTITFEAECENPGEDWEIIKDTNASNGAYIKVKQGMQSISNAPSNDDAHLEITYNLDTIGTYAFYARVNCPTADDDSFWLSFDNSSFQMFDGLGSDGWEWKHLLNLRLGVGNHTLKIAYREDGAKLDKISISNILEVPDSLGTDAENTCDVAVNTNLLYNNEGYYLGQNYPNPFSNETHISFGINQESLVSLKVYNVYGEEIKELAGKVFPNGKHSLKMESQNLPEGIYIYTLKTNHFQSSKKMHVQKLKILRNN